MAKHEFGIMKNKPMNTDRFDEYEPNKYNCIQGDDDFAVMSTLFKSPDVKKTIEDYNKN